MRFAVVSFLISCGIFLGTAHGETLRPDTSEGLAVYDFEDGLQGWAVAGTAQRANTSSLGGEWAILGDGAASGRTGSASIQAVVDLTHVSAVSVDQLFLGETATSPDFLTIRISSVSTGSTDGSISVNQVLDLFSGYERFFRGTSESDPSTRTVAFDQAFVGPHSVRISWGRTCPPFVCDPLTQPVELTGFLDNVTLHLVPEPCLMLLGSAAIGASLLLRRAGDRLSSTHRF